MGSEHPVEYSPGFAQWMIRHCVSLVCSSSQQGRLLFVGSQSSGLPFCFSTELWGAMGLAAFSQRVYVATQTRIWRFENTLRANQLIDDRYDRVFVPRNAQLTGLLSLHELCVEHSSRIVFANTRYSCLATVSPNHSFNPVWRPPFISKLAPEDRCHLNGVGMEEQRVRYVSVCSTTDVADGWRRHRKDGGVVFDISNNCVVADGLSMPHSPRAQGGFLWVNNSGTGELCRIDLQTGKREAVAFCPGFLRGLTFIGNYAVTTLSLPRHKTFQGLALEDALAQRKVNSWCGLCVVDIRSGDIVEWMRLDSDVTELFDVSCIPMTRCPMAIAPDSLDLQDTTTFEDEVMSSQEGADASLGRRVNSIQVVVPPLSLGGE
jgi:uncharacterized protein (TIGR03032 family)